MRRVEVLYSGRVQGVGFRATVLNFSQRYQVAGYVRNLANGTVEVVAEGSESEVDSFLDAIRVRFARNLSDESIHRGKANGEMNTFEIRS